MQLITMGLMQALARFIAVALLLGLWLLAVRFGHTWIPLSPLCAAAFVVMMGGRARAGGLLLGGKSGELSNLQSGSWEIEFLPECTLINAPSERDHKDEAETAPSAKNYPLYGSEESKSEAASYVVGNAEEKCENMIAPIESKAESVIEKKVLKKAGKKATKKSAS
jgi:hypothetical protein